MLQAFVFTVVTANEIKIYFNSFAGQRKKLVYFHAFRVQNEK